MWLRVPVPAFVLCHLMRLRGKVRESLRKTHWRSVSGPQLQADLGGDMYFDIGWGQLELLECARNASGGLNYSKSRLVHYNCQHDQNAEVWDRKHLGEWQPAALVCLSVRARACPARWRSSW